MHRLTRDEMLMNMALLASERSTCSRLHVGAIAASSGRVLSTGYNGAPTGLPHCDHTQDDGPCQAATHAEANVIAFAARHGVSLRGADMYVTHAPCVSCAHLIINAGISIVFYANPFRDRAGIELLHRAHVGIVHMKEFQTA